jgi:hypothetical protein
MYDGAAVRRYNNTKPVSTGLPPSSGLGWEEVRGPSSEAVSAGVANTAADFAAESAGAADSAAVETLVAPPVPGVQKPPRWVGKRFRDRFVAAPLLKE